MFLKIQVAVREYESFPHASGGVSVKKDGKKEIFLFSPREWGCFLVAASIYLYKNVFPTRVGVFL